MITPWPDDGCVVVDHHAAEADDLLAEFLTRGQDVGRDVGAERGPETSVRTDSKSSLVASSARFWRRSTRIRLAGSLVIRRS